MLDLRADRIGYSADLLVPPDGFRFERAVATTYSLELETLLATLLPLAFGETEDSDAFRDGNLLLSALKKTGPRLTVFYQAGQIHTTRRDTALFPLLDRILVPVAPEKGGSPDAPSFHPKTWTIEYRNDSTGDSFCRFAVLSRNLTFDGCLDVSFAVESGLKPNRSEENETKRVCDFLSFLRADCLAGVPAKVRESHGDRINRLRKALQRHPLGLGESFPWTSFEILPFFPGRSSAKRPLLDDPLFSKGELDSRERLHDVVVVSPFLGDGVVSRIANRIRRPDDASTVGMDWPDPSGAHPCRIPLGSALVTRPESFASLSERNRPSPETLPAWAPKDGATPEQSADDADERKNLDPHDSGLHAKVFLWRRPGETNLLLGSMNATHSGLCRNVEMMVRLRCSPRSYGGKRLLEDLFGREWWKDAEKNGPANPFEPISAGESLSADEIQGERDRKTAQDAIRDFCRCGAKGRVEKGGDGFAFVLSIPASFGPPREVRCSIRPLRGKTDAEVVPGILRFGGFPLADLSDFFVFSAKTSSCTVSRIVQLHVDGIDAYARDAAVQAAVVAGIGWRNCLEMLFAEDPVWTAAEQRERREPGAVGASSEGVPPGFYESMLRAATRDDAMKTFQDARALLEGQSGPDVDKVRELLEVFLGALSPGRKGK